MGDGTPIEVEVLDLKLSKRFYVELFKWEVLDENDERVIFGAKGKARIKLVRLHLGPEDTNLFEQRDTGILILSRDLDALKAKLRAKRILFKQPHARKLQIIDPDQNLITVRQPRPQSEPHARYSEPRLKPPQNIAPDMDDAED